MIAAGGAAGAIGSSKDKITTNRAFSSHNFFFLLIFMFGSYLVAVSYSGYMEINSHHHSYTPHLQNPFP